MLTTGIHPDKLKVSKVVPIHKKDSDSVFNDYRPISLLPSISKNFEKVIFEQLYNFFSRQRNYYLLLSMVFELNTLQNLLHMN